MLKNAYLVAEIGADTAENERNFAKESLKRNWQPPYPSARPKIPVLLVGLHSSAFLAARGRVMAGQSGSARRDGNGAGGPEEME